MQASGKLKKQTQFNLWLVEEMNYQITAGVINSYHLEGQHDQWFQWSFTLTLLSVEIFPSV